MNRRATIADVAAACGVSKGTVSRILNRSPGFSASADVRARVEAAAGRLGYRPDSLARALFTKRTQIVAVLGLWPWTLDGSDYYPPLVRSAVDSVQAAGFHAAAHFPHPQLGRYPVEPFRADGALLLAPCQEQDLTAVEAAGLPYVSIDGLAGPHGHAVLVDDHAGSRLAAAHLRERGHRRVAWYGFPDFGHHSNADRRSALAETLEVVDLPSTVDQALLGRALGADGATALVCYRSAEAARFLDAGWVPPGRAVLAFNDTPEAVRHALTVVSIPLHGLGAAAAAMLLGLMAGRSAPTPMRVAPSLVERASTARKPTP